MNLSGINPIRNAHHETAWCFLFLLFALAGCSPVGEGSADGGNYPKDVSASLEIEPDPAVGVQSAVRFTTKAANGFNFDQQRLYVVDWDPGSYNNRFVFSVRTIESGLLLPTDLHTSIPGLEAHGYNDQRGIFFYAQGWSRMEANQEYWIEFEIEFQSLDYFFEVFPVIANVTADQLAERLASYDGVLLTSRQVLLGSN